MSPSVKTTSSSPASGNPIASQSRLARSSCTPAAAQTWALVYRRGPPSSVSSSRRSAACTAVGAESLAARSLVDIRRAG
jgi:hypothetical protein